MLNTSLNQVEEKQNSKKIIPKGGLPTEQINNYLLIQKYIANPLMYTITCPFKHYFLSYIILQKSQSQKGNTLSVYHQASRKCLLKAYPMNNQIGCKYIIKNSEDEIVGRFRGNFLNSQFMLFDSGYNPQKKKIPIRKQLASIHIQKWSLLSNQPFNLLCTLANHKETDKLSLSPNHTIFQTVGIEQVDPSKSQLDTLKNQNSKLVHYVSSVKPKYCQIKKAYIVDMKGIVTEASPINSVIKTLGQEQCMIIGKRSQSTYIMTIGNPLSLLQGFALMMSTKISNGL